MKIKGKFVIENLRTKEHIFIDNFGLFPDDIDGGSASFIFNSNIYPIINRWINLDIYAGTFVSKYDLVFDINIYDITGCLYGDEEISSWLKDKPCIELKNVYISSLDEFMCKLNYDWHFIHYDNFISNDIEDTKLNTFKAPYRPQLVIPFDESVKYDDAETENDDDWFDDDQYAGMHLFRHWLMDEKDFGKI